MTLSMIRNRIAAEYATCEDPIAFAKELGITPSRMRYHAQQLGVKRGRIAQSFEKNEAARLSRAADDARRIVETAMANRLDLEVAWHQVVAA